MEYSLYKLEFSTALHMGEDTGGASLDNSRMTIHSDTLFSALCCEAARDGRITQLIQFFSEDVLTISDTFPYAGEEFFLPKPIIFVDNEARKSEEGQKKLFKSLEFIPFSRFNDYLQGLKGDPVDLNNMSRTFGHLTTNTKVAIKGQELPLPYHVASWRFLPECALYLIVRSQNEKALAFFEELLIDLGLSGVGGKQSSGLGKFTPHRTPLPQELLYLLEDEEAKYQMLLGTALPTEEEMDEALQDGWYATIRRGGFVRSETYAPQALKKKTIYMLSPGSSLTTRFTGGLFNLADGGAHPVWRCGKTLFMGVNL